MSREQMGVELPGLAECWGWPHCLAGPKRGSAGKSQGCRRLKWILSGQLRVSPHKKTKNVPNMFFFVQRFYSIWVKSTDSEESLLALPNSLCELRGHK